MRLLLSSIPVSRASPRGMRVVAATATSLLQSIKRFDRSVGCMYARFDEILQLRPPLLPTAGPLGSLLLATAPHGARLAVGPFPRLLRGNVNRLARLATAALCGWGIPHGHRGGA